jgi:hypothetical protein
MSDREGGHDRHQIPERCGREDQHAEKQEVIIVSENVSQSMPGAGLDAMALP